MVYDFNNPQILRGYLEQAKKQFDLNDDAERRIEVGCKGGLIYLLFEGHSGGLAIDFKASRLREFNEIGKYFEDVSSYLDKAEHHAKRYGFNKVNHIDRVIKEDLGDDDLIYNAGIGSANIESVEKLEKFLEMVHKVHTPLNKAYVAIKTSVSKIRK